MGKIVVDPLAARGDVELANVAVGANKVDVMAIVGTGIGIERAAGGGDSIAGEQSKVVIDPVVVGIVKALVDVSVGANVVDVLLGEVRACSWGRRGKTRSR